MTALPLFAFTDDKHLDPYLDNTEFDYRGEPTPYYYWPTMVSHFGIMDLCGFPKDGYYAYKAAWTNEPVPFKVLVRLLVLVMVIQTVMSLRKQIIARLSMDIVRSWYRQTGREAAFCWKRNLKGYLRKRYE